MPRPFLKATLIVISVCALPLAATRANGPIGYAPGDQPEPYVVDEQPGYAHLDAPLYSCPRPEVPPEVGGAYITNPALAPHEMLYPHTYKALYPPYVYKTRWRWGYRVGAWPEGKWYAFPCIYRVRVACKTKLQGTQVKVKYNSSISPSALFFPPNATTDFGR